MSRSELAGINRAALDLDNGTLAVGATRVVVRGRPEDSDGKSDAEVREISLDPFTVDLLRHDVTLLDKERRAGVRRSRLHDIRHTYSTISLDAGIDPSGTPT